MSVWVTGLNNPEQIWKEQFQSSTDKELYAQKVWNEITYQSQNSNGCAVDDNEIVWCADKWKRPSGYKATDYWFTHNIDCTVVMKTKTQVSWDVYEKLSEYYDTTTSGTQTLSVINNGHNYMN